MTDPFEYDVFISFSSADEEIVKPIWQELCSNGLRVFWSDSSLKKEVGNSWFEVIEKSLERSRHMLLICSDNSMSSKWVQREYRAFFDYCYSHNSRRLIPLLAHNFQPNNLPLFLRQLQVGKINDPQFIQEMIPILGGVNIENLKYELQSLKEQVNLLSMENEALSEHSKADAKKVKVLTRENTAAKEKIEKLSIENTSLKEQITKLTDECNVLKETLHERENSLRSEKISLKEQMAELNNENKFLSEKLQNQEKSSSSEIISQAHPEEVVPFTEDEEERKRVEKYGVEVVRCPKCKTINSLWFVKCMNCSTSLIEEKSIHNPYL
jgi:cell division protein FtsB